MLVVIESIQASQSYMKKAIVGSKGYIHQGHKDEELYMKELQNS